MQANRELKLEVYMRRNHHPFLSSTYINGYIKDQSLKGMGEEEVLRWFTKVNAEFGRRSLKHSDAKVVSERPSIQGQWTNETWGAPSLHMMESKYEIPSRTMEELPPRPKLSKKLRPHSATRIARKKYVIV